MNSTVFFDGWAGLVRVVVVGTIAYAALVVLLRVGGKRTLSRMNAFDFIVTVSFGSTLATTLVSKQVPLLEGVVALALLVALQYAVAWTEVRSDRVRGIVRSEPALLAWRGRFMAATMRRERVGDDDVLAAARGTGVLSIKDVHAAILETNGSISIVPRHSTSARRRYGSLGQLRLHALESDR